MKEGTWSPFLPHRIHGEESDHVDMVMYIRNGNNAIKNMTMSLFPFPIKFTQGGL